MLNLLEIVRNLVIFVLIIGGLVLLHELGHFLAAVRLNVPIEEFGIGLPPRMVKLGSWRGTIFSLNWIPLGGFVRPKAEDEPEVLGGFAGSRPGVRIAILAAGPVANLLVGYLVFVIGFMAGWPDQVRIVEVVPDSPAEAASLVVDDVVLQAGGQPIRNSGQLIDVFTANLGSEVELTIRRGDDTLTTTITPSEGWSAEKRITGVALTDDRVRYPLPQASIRAGETLITQIRTTLLLPVQLLSGEVNPQDIRVISPVGLKQVSDRVVRNSIRWQEWYPVINLIAVVSVALGITNILPIPALDGGRIVFALVELLRGRRINPTVEKWVHVAGLLALYALLVFLVVQDVVNPLF